MSSIPIEPESTSTQTFGAIDACGDYNAPLVGLSAQEYAAVTALPPGTALLVVGYGPTAGARFLLDAPKVTVGRHPRADIFLDDVTVSRKHALFTAEADGSYSVHDSGSLNGTYVNRQRVEHAHLHAGDEVQIGKYRMIYHPASGSRAQ